MVSARSRGQEFNGLEQIAVLGVDSRSFQHPTQFHQQLETCFVQIVVLQEL